MCVPRSLIVINTPVVLCVLHLTDDGLVSTRVCTVRSRFKVRSVVVITTNFTRSYSRNGAGRQGPRLQVGAFNEYHCIPDRARRVSVETCRAAIQCVTVLNITCICRWRQVKSTAYVTAPNELTLTVPVIQRGTENRQAAPLKHHSSNNFDLTAMLHFHWEPRCTWPLLQSDRTCTKTKVTFTLTHIKLAPAPCTSVRSSPWRTFLLCSESRQQD